MSRLRRTTWANCPMPIDRLSPSPDTPTHTSSRLAAWAPVVIDGIRPCTALSPCASLRKYAGVFPLQPIPDVLTTLCGSTSISQNACTIAAVMESCPHPAHNVDMEPS